MSKDAKAAERQRLAEALRANLRRRKVARGAREAQAADEAEVQPVPDPSPARDR